MRSFPTDDRWIVHLAYTPDCRCLVIDSRARVEAEGVTTFHPRSAADLVWWDWLAGTVQRRFRLVDVLPATTRAVLQDVGGEGLHPREVAFRVEPFRIATAWDWSGPEDGLFVNDPDLHEEVDVRVTPLTRYRALALAPDGMSLASRALHFRGEMGCLEVWHPDGTDEIIRVFDWAGDGLGWFEDAQEDATGPYRPEHALAFDGRHVASVGPRLKTLRIWDTEATPPSGTTWNLEAIDPDACVDCNIEFVPLHLAFADRAPGLAVGGAGLGVYDLATARWWPWKRSHDLVNAVAMSTDGQFLLAGTEAGVVELWDVEAGRLLQELGLDHGPITAVAFAADGLTCAAGTASGWVIVWDRDR